MKQMKIQCPCRKEQCIFKKVGRGVRGWVGGGKGALKTKRAPDLEDISHPCGIQLCYRLKCQHLLFCLAEMTEISFINF